MIHVHDNENKVETNHPLKMNFNEYLLTMDSTKLEKRIGKENAEAIMNGTARAEKYLPPMKGDRYSIENMKKDDIDSFCSKY